MSAEAAVDPQYTRQAVVEPCELTDYQSAVLDLKWNELATKHFMVSLESRDPAVIARVQAEVTEGLAALRREYGIDCVLDIL